MDLSLQRLQHYQQCRWPHLPQALAWSGYLLAVGHMAINWTITDARTQAAIRVNHLYALGSGIAVLLLLVTLARHSLNTKRWTWVLVAISFAVTTIQTILFAELRAAGLHLDPETPLVIGFTAVAYGSALLGVAWYFLHRTWWLGTQLRVVVDSLLVGIAAKVIIPSMNWMLAFDLAVMFAFGAVAMRYRARGPLVVFAFLSALCLFLGDLIYPLQLLMLQQQPISGYLAFPLYSLHHVLLAHGAYLSIQKPPHEPATADVMPISDWLLWAIVPRIAVISAILAAIVRPQHSLVLLSVFGSLVIIRELLAWHDLYRVIEDLRLAQQRFAQAAQQTREFLTRIAHDFGMPLQTTWTVITSLPLAPTTKGVLDTELVLLSDLLMSVRNELVERGAPAPGDATRVGWWNRLRVVVEGAALLAAVMTLAGMGFVALNPSILSHVRIDALMFIVSLGMVSALLIGLRYLPLTQSLFVKDLLFWSQVSRFLALGIAACAIAGVPSFPGTLPVFLVISLLREGFAARYQHWLITLLHAAQHRASQEDVDTLRTLERIATTAAEPLRRLGSLVGSNTTSDALHTLLQEQIVHMRHLADQLTAYVQARTIPLSMAPVDLVPVCMAAAHAAQGLVQGSSARTVVSVQVIFDTEHTVILGDMTATRRILDNLLANAVRAASSSTDTSVIELIVRDAADSHMVRLEVRDRGTGVPAHLQEHIFRPYFHGPNSGLGLGLAIVSELVQAMCGSYGVISTRGEPTVFYVHLRRAARPVVEPGGEVWHGDTACH